MNAKPDIPPGGISPRRLALTLGPLIALGPLAIDTYLPALPAMAESLATQVVAVERSISLYVIGTALGQLLGGPVSDHLGRKRVIYGALALFIGTSMLISLSHTLPQLELLRLLQALGGGATVVIAAASVRDWFDGQQAARVLSNIGLVMLMAPLLAPALGAMLALTLGWRWIFVALALYAMAMLVWVAVLLPPHAPVAEDRRLLDIIRGWGRVLRHREAMAIILANSLGFATLFAFVTDAAFVYLRFYQLEAGLFPLLFGSNVAAMIAFNRLNVWLLGRVPARRLIGFSLAGQCLAALTVLALVLALGKPPLPLLVGLLMLISGAVAMTIPNAIASFSHFFPHDSGAATGINGSLQFLFAGIAGLLLTSWHNHSLLPLAVTMVVSSVLALIAIRSSRQPGA